MHTSTHHLARRAPIVSLSRCRLFSHSLFGACFLLTHVLSHIRSTFELLNPVTGERMDYWPSDRPVDVHVHIKLLNNYPKYFEPTTCKANELLRNVAVGPITIYDGRYVQHTNRV